MITEQIAAERRPPEGSEQTADSEVASAVMELAQRVRAIIEQRPVVAVLTAVGVGYVVARLVSRGGR